jgi:hypothetical protein
MADRRHIVLAAAIFVNALAAPAWADQVSGTLTRTFVIVEDTDLVGDVVCNVGSNPCFSFGASNVELRLNGFSMTGTANAVTGCGGAIFANEFGVTTNGQHNVYVRGPGLIQRFRNFGITVTGGSRGTKIEGLTASTNCGSGIRVTAAAFDTLVQGNRLTGNGATAVGAACGGI